MLASRIDLASLSTWVVGPADATTTCVLLHGFGAGGDDLVALADAIDAPGVRFVFPAAPLELPGMYGDSRAWWMIDLERLASDQARGVVRNRRAEIPDRLPEARGEVIAMLDALQAQFGVAPGELVLGGFSQGAMLSLDVALHREVPPAALVLMSGTLIAEPVWQPRLARLAGVPVMLSHGRGDGLLPFAAAEILRDLLIGAGAAVDWQPFTGGHEIPHQVVEAAERLLRARTGQG